MSVSRSGIAGAKVYVIDANTVVSAALNPVGIPRQAIVAARSHGVIALWEAIYREMVEVLARPKFARVLTEEQRHEILHLLALTALWAEPTVEVKDCRDAKDNFYLALASATGASAIVSGDNDLLVLDPWRGIRVLRPSRFLDVLRGSA